MGATWTGWAVDAALKTLGDSHPLPAHLYLLLTKIQESAHVLFSGTFRSGSTNKILCIRSTPRDGLLVLPLIFGENRADDSNWVGTDASGTRLMVVRAMPFLTTAVVDGKRSELDQN